MARRLVTARTTLDREYLDCIRLEVEVDNLSEEHLPAHEDELELTAERAREPAADLEKRTDRVDEAESGRVSSGRPNDRYDGRPIRRLRWLSAARERLPSQAHDFFSRPLKPRVRINP